MARTSRLQRPNLKRSSSAKSALETSSRKLPECKLQPNYFCTVILIDHFPIRIYSVHDEVKDKAFELELSWIGKETNGLHQAVPKKLHDEAVHFAQESLKHQSDSDEDSIS